jgi:hypothetical protein
MIAQLLTELQAAEQTAIKAAKIAKDAYIAMGKKTSDPEKLAPLDPGRHITALGCVRTAIQAVQTVMANAADAQEQAAEQPANAAPLNPGPATPAK